MVCTSMTDGVCYPIARARIDGASVPHRWSVAIQSPRDGRTGDETRLLGYQGRSTDDRLSIS